MPKCTKFQAPGGCRFGHKSAHEHTAQPADEKNNSASAAIHIPSNDERQMQFLKIQSDDKASTPSETSYLANEYVLRRKHLDLHLESSRLDLNISRIQTLQHSRQDLSHGLWAWKKNKEISLDLSRTCTTFQVRILRNEKGSSNQVLHLPCNYVERERYNFHCGLWSFTSFDE